jgi:hypothetical protein
MTWSFWIILADILIFRHDSERQLEFLLDLAKDDADVGYISLGNWAILMSIDIPAQRMAQEGTGRTSFDIYIIIFIDWIL